MHKRGILLTLVFLFSLALASAGSVDDEMQKLTHYAEEYETGNIDYVQLMVYMSAARESLNELMGVSSRQEGGLLRQEQLRNVLGEPEEKTKWVWVEREEHEIRLDNYIPVWKKIPRGAEPHHDGWHIPVEAAIQEALQK